MDFNAFVVIVSVVGLLSFAAGTVFGRWVPEDRSTETPCGPYTETIGTCSISCDPRYYEDVLAAKRYDDEERAVEADNTAPSLTEETLRRVLAEMLPWTEEEEKEIEERWRRVIREELATVMNQGMYADKFVDAIEREAKSSHTSPSFDEDSGAVVSSVQDAIVNSVQPREGVEVPLGATGEIRNCPSPSEAARMFGGLVRRCREGICMSLGGMASSCNFTIRQVDEMERGEFVPSPGTRDLIIAATNPPWETREEMLKCWEFAWEPYKKGIKSI